MYQILYQSHAGSWAILILFFFLTYFFHKQKWLGIITRIFYLIMLISGIGMLVLLKFPLIFIIKGIIAIGLIAIMELILVNKKKGQVPAPYWVAFAIDLMLVILIGFKVIQSVKSFNL